MNIFDLSAKIALDTSGFVNGINNAAGKMGSFASSVGSVIGGVTKVTVAGFTTMAAGVTKLATEAVKSYADYEQLVGGVETLFGLGGESMDEYAKRVGKTVNEISNEWMAATAGQRIVLNNASEAYKTAGLSANEYMETVTSFAASLTQSLEGDTKAAAQKADMAITDMADNANKMGTSMESIQNAYQGFAKQNYTMLDNLKLGYGGTKEEMQRLLSDAQKLSGIKYDISSYADIVDAIHVVQSEMEISGITMTEYTELVESGAMTEEEAFKLLGTTAKEANFTISGSFSSMKAAWENLVTGIANTDPETDIESLVDNVVSSAETFATNVIPAVETALGGIGQIIEKVAPTLAEKLPTIIETVLPSLITAAGSLLQGIVSALPELIQILVEALPEIIETTLPILIESLSSVAATINESLPELIETALPIIVEQLSLIFQTLAEYLNDPTNLETILTSALSIVTTIGQGILNNIPLLLETVNSLITGFVGFLVQEDVLTKLVTGAFEIITTIANALIELLPELIPSVVALIDQLVTSLTDPDNLSGLLDTALVLIETLAMGILDNLPQLIDTAITLITNFIEYILKPENILKVQLMSLKLILQIAAGLIAAIPKLLLAVVEIIDSLIDTFMETDWLQLGKDIVNGIWDGLKAAWENLKKWFTDAWDSLVGGVKDLLGIHSPSKVFAEIGGYMAEGVGVGWDDEFPDIKKQVEGDFSMDFETKVAENSTEKINNALINKFDEFSDNLIDTMSNLEFSVEGRTFGRLVNKYA